MAAVEGNHEKSTTASLHSLIIIKICDCGGQVSWLMPAIQATREAEIGKIMVQGQPRQKVSGPISTNKPGMVLPTNVPVILAKGKTLGRRITV
jgi:hypothetical protein